MKSQHTTIAPRQFVSAALGAVALTVVLATATLAPTFVGVASASIQAVRVSYSDFPTVAEVAEHYPHLDGGTREMFGNAQVFVPSTGNCSGLWEFARHQPRIGKFMVYEPARVATAGRDDPQVLLRGSGTGHRGPQRRPSARSVAASGGASGGTSTTAKGSRCTGCPCPGSAPRASPTGTSAPIPRGRVGPGRLAPTSAGDPPSSTSTYRRRPAPRPHDQRLP
jgi:hypothetical protein